MLRALIICLVFASSALQAREIDSRQGLPVSLRWADGRNEATAKLVSLPGARFVPSTDGRLYVANAIVGGLRSRMIGLDFMDGHIGSVTITFGPDIAPRSVARSLLEKYGQPFKAEQQPELLMTWSLGGADSRWILMRVRDGLASVTYASYQSAGRAEARRRLGGS